MKIGIVGSGLVGSTAAYALEAFPLPLSEAETSALQASAQTIRAAIEALVAPE